MDYSKLNVTGDKVLTAQKVKIDLNTKCSYCESWDATNDPPNWGLTLRNDQPVSLEISSEDDDESLFRDIEIEKTRLRREALQEVIDKLERSGASDNFLDVSAPEYDLFHELPDDDEDVFETTVDDRDVTVSAITKRVNRTVSTDVNIFGSADCQSNSEDYFVASRISPRRTSLDCETSRRVTRSRSALTRVPLETTPLKKTPEDNNTTPGSPP